MSEKSNRIIELIPLIMKEVGAIGKDRQNSQQNYRFRGIDDAFNALHGPLSEHGVFFVPEIQGEPKIEERTTQKGGLLIYTRLVMKYTFFAPDGSSLSVVTPGEAMDSGDKSTNKAMSAALKYALLQLFCIPTEEDNDTENSSPAPLPKSNAPANRAPAKPASEKPSKPQLSAEDQQFLADFDKEAARLKWPVARNASDRAHRDALIAWMKANNKTMATLTDDDRMLVVAGLATDANGNGVLKKFVPAQKKAA